MLTKTLSAEGVVARAVAIIWILALATAAAGQTAIWKGNESTRDGDWHDEENWDIAGTPGVPGSEHSVHISNGGTAQMTSGGEAAFVTVGPGSLEVLGSGAAFGSMIVGRDSSGNVEIVGGNVAADGDVFLGMNAGSSGNVKLTGGALTDIFQLYVGKAGSGTLEISAATVSSDFGWIADALGSNGTVTATGAATWNNSGSLQVGNYGTAKLTIAGNSTVTNTDTSMGTSDTGDGRVEVRGGSTWTNNGYVRVGEFGGGGLEILSGSTVTSYSGIIAAESRSIAVVRIDAATWTNAAELIVGGSGSAGLVVDNGGSITSTYATIANGSESDANVLVRGEGSTWTLSSSLSVGGFGSGTLDITSGGSVITEGLSAYIGANSGSTGTVVLSGGGSKWTIDGLLYVGGSGTGELRIEDNSAVESVGGSIGFAGNSHGTVFLEDGSVWSNSGYLRVGDTGEALLGVTGGATVTSNSGTMGVGADSSGWVTITGAGSKWNIAGDLTVANSGLALLQIADGSVTNNSAVVGRFSGSRGSVQLHGAGAVWTNYGALTIGESGEGILEVDGGMVVSDSGVIGRTGSSNGSVEIVNRGKWTITGGELRVGESGQGKLSIRNGGTVEAKNVIVGPRGEIDGSGNIVANVVNHGTVSVGQSIGTITVEGDYEQPDGLLEIEVAGPGEGESDQLVVTGDTTLGGTIRMFFLNGYAPRAGDVFDFLSVRGGFVDQGLSIELPNLLPGFEYERGFDAASGGFSLTALNDAQLALLPGDYNGNGLVEQADLDLVLTNWGGDATLPPDGWDHDLPSGFIDQGELDGVLSNWGKTPASVLSTAAVPEPASVTLVSLGALALVCFVMHRRTPANGGNAPERSSFFDVPPRLGIWSQVGGRFWGGVVLGVGIGLFLGVFLVEQAVITPKPGKWSPEVTGPTLVLGWIGIMIAARAVRRSRDRAQETANEPK